jgi:hypothetical protein
MNKSNWETQKMERQTRQRAGARFAQGKMVAAHDSMALLEAVKEVAS